MAPIDRRLYPQKPWHWNDTFLKGILETELNEKGYIDLPDYIPPTDTTFVPESRPRECRTNLPIHPVLHPKRFEPPLQKAEYFLLRPALRLVTCFLDEPCALPFFHGLIRQPYRQFRDPYAEQKLKTRPLDRFLPLELHETEFPPLAPPKDKKRKRSEWDLIDLAGKLYDVDDEVMGTWQKLFGLQHYVTFRFGKLENGYDPSGATSVHVTEKGLKDGYVENRTNSSIITLQQEFLDILKGNVNSDEFPNAAKFNVDCARTRTYFLLAITIVHELCHAVHKAYHDRDDTWAMEPFFRDDRIAEVGYAFENFFFTGDIQPIGHNPPSYAAPYGLFISRWPGLNNTETAIRGRPARFGVRRSTRYAVPMDYVHKFFTAEFWDEEIARYGPSSLRPRRLLGVRRYATDPLSPNVKSGDLLQEPSPLDSESGLIPDKYGVIRRDPAALPC